VSRKSRKLFGPEKPFVKFQTAHSVKLVFSYVIKAKQIKITATFRAPGRLRFEDTKKMMSPKIRLSCFLRLPCEASVPERRKNVYQTTRDVCSILFFGRQTGWEQRRGGEKETFPTLPYPYPYFHFSLSTRFLLLLFLFVFFSVSQAKNVVFVCFIFVGNAFYAFSFGYLFAACIRGLPEQTFVSVLVDHTFRQNDGSC